jgi:tryptophan-rich sensory protein
MIAVHLNAAVIAATACAIAATVEGLAAGSGFKQRMAELRIPRFSPPLPVWILVGIGYYAIAGVVLYRLLTLTPSTPRRAALLLLATILAVNAYWNYLFFRRRSLRQSFLLGLPYTVIAIVLSGLLFRLDPSTAWLFLPYTLYLTYANTWTYRIWQLNDTRES